MSEPTLLAWVSQALIRLGAEAITSFADGSAEAEIAARIAAPERDAFLTAWPWSFAGCTKALVRRADRPDIADGHATLRPWALPAGFLLARDIVEAAAYRIEGDVLYTDLDKVTLTFTTRTPEPDWPGWAVAPFVARLAAAMAMPVTESTSRADMLARHAAQMERQARRIDASQRPLVMGDSSLVLVR